MANPQIENGYTKIANEIIEAICKHPEIMRGSLFAVIAVVWRQTWGWNKKEDAISISQFTEMTGLSKRTIIYALQELEAKNVLKIRRSVSQNSKNTNVISFNKDYNSWVVQNSAQQVQNNRGSAKLRKKVVQNSVKNVQSFAHTKERKKIQKKITENKFSDLSVKGKNMPFNKYSDDYEEGVVDLDGDGEINNPEAEEKEKNKERQRKKSALVDWLIDHQGRDPKKTNRPKQLKALNELITMNVSPAEIKQTIMELEGEDYWSKNNILPDFKSVVSRIQSRGR